MDWTLLYGCIRHGFLRHNPGLRKLLLVPGTAKDRILSNKYDHEKDIRIHPLGRLACRHCNNFEFLRAERAIGGRYHSADFGSVEFKPHSRRLVAICGGCAYVWLQLRAGDCFLWRYEYNSLQLRRYTPHDRYPASPCLCEDISNCFIDA
jgi:hypothetical protein